MASISKGLRGEELTEMAELARLGAAAFTDDGCIGRLNFAVIELPTFTPVWPLTGVKAVTVGGVRSG